MNTTKEGEGRLKAVLMTYFPMFIATLSLCTAIFNGYLNSKFLDFIERNTGRVEYMRTCKDIIDAYFQIKFRAGVISADAAAGSAPRDDRDGTNAVNKFAALGTYLANLRDDTVRKQYTELTAELGKAMTNAKRVPPAEVGSLFTTADRMFEGLNNDCVKSARGVI